MYHYTSVDQDFFSETNSSSQDFWAYEEESPAYDPSTICLKEKKPLREKNGARKNNVFKHVPHKDKPPQVVERRNARERKRVQAVNSAFVKLRNVVPIHNARGKRISKVKTLLYAMQYIRALDQILQDCGDYSTCYDMIKCQKDNNSDFDFCEHWTYGKSKQACQNCLTIYAG